MDKLVSCDTENEASRETESGASRGTEIGLLAEAFRGEPRARRRLRQDAETSCARLEARWRAWWARTWWVWGPRLTF